MRKILSFTAVILILSSIFCLFAACDSSEDTLVMATNAAFPPYEYKSDSGEFEGIDVEIATLIAERLGMTLQIEDVEFGAIVSGVASGKYDMGMAGMTVTEERLESVNFSDTYANGVQVVIVPEDSEYQSFEDFYSGFTTVDGEEVPAGVKEGIKIGVQQDTTGDVYSSDTPEKWGFGEENVQRYKTGADAILDLKTGRLTAVIIDNEPAKAYVEANEGLKILDGEYANEDYAICFAKDNTELMDKVNTVLKELTDEGKIQEILDKYIK